LRDEIYILAICEILPVYLADRRYLSVAFTGDKYCIFGRVLEFMGPQMINYYMMWKICSGEPWNLANWTTEFGKFAADKCGL